jgi:hypothetical protein
LTVVEFGVFGVEGIEASEAVRSGGGAFNGRGCGIWEMTYPPIGPPLVELVLAFVLEDDEGIRKTGSPNGERPVEETVEPVNAPELDKPLAWRPPALADEMKSALQANATMTA